MFTIKDAAQALGIHPKTIRRWEEKGKFTPLRTPGNQRRFSEKDLNLLARLKAGDPVPVPAEKILTLAQAAEKLTVNPVTVKRWTKAGKLNLSVNNQLEPGYRETDIRKLLQGPSLPVLPEPEIPQKPTRTDPMGKYLPYAGIAGLVLALGILAYLWLQPKPIASPAILETQTPVVDIALPRTAQFLDGRITLGLNTGDLFYADATGNLYLKNSALIDQSVYTHNLQLLPTTAPQEQQVGQLYVDQSSGNLMYFDGLEWINLNQNASQSAVTNQFPYDITLGDLNASASAESLRITLAGDQSQFKILGGASQDILTVNDDALYPVIISQPTQILGNLTAPKLIDADQSGYFLDPSSTDLSLSVAGNATISSTLKFSNYGDYLTNSVDNYLVFSGGIGVGGSPSYGFSPDQKINIRSGNVESTLTVGGNLNVAGDIITDATTYPDYVFEPDYPLLSPLQLKEFISQQRHLPGVPSLTEVETNGLSLKQLLLAVLEKTEENTLYILDLYDRSNRIISPTIQTEILTTSMISPLTDGQITISGNASVSGTLYAEAIESSTIDRLREKISELAENLNTPGVKEVPTPGVEEMATASAILEAPLPATDSGYLALTSLDADTAFFRDYLAVLGQTTLTNLTVNGNLNAGLILAQKIEISGDLLVAGAITAKEINPLPNQELSINIASGSALSIYSDIGPMATFSGQTLDLANLKLEASGTATISAGANHGLIVTDRLTDKSQVIVTFNSDYTPASKYWVTKNPAAGAFTLFTNYPVNNDTTLDWLIIN